MCFGHYAVAAAMRARKPTLPLVPIIVGVAPPRLSDGGRYREGAGAGPEPPDATPRAGAAAAGTTAGDGFVATRVVMIDRNFVTCSVSAGLSAAARFTFCVGCTSKGSSTRSEEDISW